MQHLNRRSLTLGLALLASTVGALPAWADTFPYKPIRIVVPYGAGSSPDVIMRIVAERLAQKWSPLRFLFISGFADAVVFSANKFPSCKTAFLAKPFTRKQFVKAVETLSAS